MRRWLRRLLRRYGVEWPFGALVCPEHVKTIRFDADWTTEVAVRRTLVFLELPEPGDVYDTIPVDPEDLQSVVHDSPDASEIRRVPCRRSTRVYWQSREPLVPYALYVHQYGWRTPGADGQAALYTEFHCDVRTGILALEVITPVPIESAVAFKVPRWHGMYSERSLVKQALSQLELQHEGLTITHDGSRVEWRLSGPRVGDRYICVMFAPDGVAQWQKRLQETSLGGRVKRLVRSIAPT